MNVVQKENKLMRVDINYLAAKLEEIHDDVLLLKVHVDILRQESAGRKAVQKFILGSMGCFGVVLGWLVTYVMKGY